MKAKELTDKSVDEIVELLKQEKKALFDSRLQNFTNQLDDTSSIRKHRRDIARLEGEVRRRELVELTQNVQQALAAAESK